MYKRQLLSNAVQRINGEIPELDNRVDEISDEQELSVPADPNVRNFSFTLVDGKVYFRENDRMQPVSYTHLFHISRETSKLYMKLLKDVQ